MFPRVGLDLLLGASCRLDDEDFRWQAPPFAGPTNPGEQVVVDLVVAPGEGMLFGRVVDGAGAPLAGVSPTFLLSSVAGKLEHHRGRSASRSSAATCARRPAWR